MSSRRFGAFEIVMAVAVTFGITTMVMNVAMSPTEGWDSTTRRHAFDTDSFDPAAAAERSSGVPSMKHWHHPDALGVGQHAAAAAVPEPTPEAGDDSAAAGVDKQVRMLEGKLRAANDAKDRVQTELTKRTAAAAAAAAAVGVAARNEGQPVAPPASVLPFVSIITLSAGQHFLDRNTLLNALYQSHPHERLELLVIETNERGPSELFMEWNKSLADDKYRSDNGYPYFHYWFMPPAGELKTGGKRNFLLDRARGDIIVHLDNDDIGMANYIQSLVQIFTQAATDPNLKVRGGGKMKTTKCCRDGSDGPLLRDMLNQAAYSKGMFNPDGSTEFTAENGGSKIGALTSYTGTLAKTCHFSNMQTMEEHRMFACAGSNFAIHDCDRDDMPGKNGQQLIRFIHPLSITSLGWYVDRVKWNQLTGVDMDRLYKSMSYWYEWLHELSRPIEVPRLESKASRFYGGGNTPFWHDFHKGHSKLLVGGEYPYCEGYVGTPGQMWPKPPLVPDQIVAASNALDCCNKCKGLPKDKSCNAFTFNKTAQPGCAMMVSPADDLPDNTFQGYPDKAAYFYEFESAVLLKTCHKCGGSGGFAIPK